MPLDSHAMPATPLRPARRARGRACLLLCLAALLCRAGWGQGRPGPPAAPRPAAAVRAVAPETADAVTRATLAILEFARWPGNPPLVRLCVVGTTPFAGELLAARAAWRERGRRLSVRQRTARDVSADCDALYLGRLPEAEARALRQRIASEARLTIGEIHEGCDACMFCLAPRSRGSMAFAVDLSALARSGVRVHPGVLQLGTRRAGGT